MNDSTGNWPKWFSGVLNVVSGVAQAALGAALGATVGWTGIGAVAAAALIANGAATTVQGIGQVVNTITQTNTLREDNLIRTGAQHLGYAVGGDTGATVAGMAYDVAIFAAALYTPPVHVPAATSTPVGGACFAAGTVVLTSTGYVAIECIRAGDLVWAENPETGERMLKRVIQTFINEADKLIRICINGEEIITTSEHPFFVRGRGWVMAADLHKGDLLVMQNGDAVAIQSMYCECLDIPLDVYNFEVADFHTYYVGENSVLVHNICGMRNTPDQDAVIQLANEFKNGVSRSVANIFFDWAKEYGLKAHYPMIHPNRSGIWSTVEHIKIFNLHIPIK